MATCPGCGRAIPWVSYLYQSQFVASNRVSCPACGRSSSVTPASGLIAFVLALAVLILVFHTPLVSTLVHGRTLNGVLLFFAFAIILHALSWRFVIRLR